jgi:S1-C subfamily serine protease
MSIAAPPRRSHAPSLPLALAATALVAVVALAIVLAATGSLRPSNDTTTVQQAAGAPAGPGLNAAVLYAQANPGVVDITGQTTTSVPGPFGLSEKAAATQSGTGLVLDKHGHILTAGHVVAGAHDITVTFQGGATRTAKVLGSDTSADVAVLSVPPSGLTLHPLSLGTLSGHRVGDPVAVIGDPFDVQRSLSTGVISGLDHTIPAPNGYNIPHAVQTDAAMNPGNSGGPVLDAGGRVIGIADQIDTGNSSADSSTGVGFAVPIDLVKSELSELQRGATPAHAYLGVSAADATNSAGDTGALVQSVQAGSPAARAGVRPGDLIVAIGGAKVAGVNDVTAAIANHKPGDHTTVKVIRSGKKMSLTTTLAKQPTRAVTG